MKEIKVPSTFIRKLTKEFDVTPPTVYASLKYYNNSDVAKSIRTRAVEMLEELLNQAKAHEQSESNPTGSN